jgi:uncharacterized protein
LSVEFDQVLSNSIAWLELAVIKLNLCPFAKAVHRKGQIHWRISAATSFSELDDVLENVLESVQASDASIIDTAILVLPNALPDFFDFNIYLAQANARLCQMGLKGSLQIASFHPRYCFEGTLTSDVGNATNQAPYPMLHILRETSLTRAIEAYSDTDAIVLRNQQVLNRLGESGWRALQKRMYDTE